MKACLETTSMFCSREKFIGLTVIKHNEKSTQILLTLLNGQQDLPKQLFKYDARHDT